MALPILSYARGQCAGQVQLAYLTSTQLPRQVRVVAQLLRIPQVGVLACGGERREAFSHSGRKLRPRVNPIE